MTVTVEKRPQQQDESMRVCSHDLFHARAFHPSLNASREQPLSAVQPCATSTPAMFPRCPLHCPVPR